MFHYMLTDDDLTWRQLLKVKMWRWLHNLALILSPPSKPIVLISNNINGQQVALLNAIICCCGQRDRRSKSRVGLKDLPLVVWICVTAYNIWTWWIPTRLWQCGYCHLGINVCIFTLQKWHFLHTVANRQYIRATSRRAKEIYGMNFSFHWCDKKKLDMITFFTSANGNVHSALLRLAGRGWGCLAGGPSSAGSASVHQDLEARQEQL